MDHSFQTLFWKEWRAKAWLLLVAPVAIFLGWAVKIPLGSSDYEGFLMSFAFSAALIGVTFMSGEEHDPARSFIYQLPISRREIFMIKLGANALQLFLLLIVCMAVAVTLFSDLVRVWQDRPEEEFLFSLPFFTLPLWPMAAIFIYMLRSHIVAMALTAAAGIPVVAMLIFQMEHGRDLGWLVGQSLLFTLLLGVVFYFVFTRSAVQERGPNMRTFLSLLTVVAIVEAAFTLFMANWRDVLFIVFGV